MSCCWVNADDGTSPKDRKAQGWPQGKIAATIGMSKATFARLAKEDEGNNELRLAWERGRADLEFELASSLLEQAKSGQTIATLFYLKNMGWSDTPPVQTNNGLTIVLPGAMSREDYLKSIQQPLPELVVLPDDKKEAGDV
jgi:hypothetical protein